MHAQVVVRHQDLVSLGLTEQQLAEAIQQALANNLRHPVTGEPMKLPTLPAVSVRDDRPPISGY